MSRNITYVYYRGIKHCLRILHNKRESSDMISINNILNYDVIINTQINLISIYLYMFITWGESRINWCRFLARTQENQILKKFFYNDLFFMRKKRLSPIETLIDVEETMESFLKISKFLYRDIWLSRRDMFIWHYILIMMDANVVGFHRFLKIARSWKYVDMPQLLRSNMIIISLLMQLIITNNTVRFA